MCRGKGSWRGLPPTMEVGVGGPELPRRADPCLAMQSGEEAGDNIRQRTAKSKEHRPNRSRNEQGASREEDGGGYQATEPWKPGRHRAVTGFDMHLILGGKWQN